MKPLRVAVIGCGHMGRHHAEKVVALGERDGSVTLSAVVDLDRDVVQAAASDFRTRAATEAGQLVGEADAAVIAVPTVDHFEAARQALEANLDVLIEKPIAANIEQGEQLLALAQKQERILLVGHQEWFNPALRAIHQRIRSPRFVEVHRMTPFRERATDIDVVRDLMIHDLDILQQLLGETPERIEAIGVPVVTSQVDIANARLTFPGGCVANLTASRVSMTPMRKIRFIQRDGYFSIDFLTQSATIIRKLGGNGEDAARIDVEELSVDPDDALVSQLQAFVAAIGARSVSGVTVSDPLGALRTALRVIDAMPPYEELQ